MTPAVIFLASEDAPNRQIIAAGAGGFAKVTIQETPGIFLKPGDRTAENVAAEWDKIAETEGMRELQFGGEQNEKFLTRAASALGINLGS